MPLGNLTSQFFANVYLNELDQFVKHKIKVKFYIRYVDDFVLLHQSRDVLEAYKEQIDRFLKNNLALALHPNKCKIFPIQSGIPFLGFRVFYHHKLLRKANVRKMQRALEQHRTDFHAGIITYDKIYEHFQGWLAYAQHANTYQLRKRMAKNIEAYFPNKISTIEYNRIRKRLLHIELKAQSVPATSSLSRPV